MKHAKTEPVLRKTLHGALCLVLAGFLSAGAQEPAKLPAFSLPDLEGKEWNSAQFAGKPVVIDFWASWCASCKQTVPKLAELSEKHKDKGLVVVGISVDKGSQAKIKKAAKKFGITYLVLHDAGDGMSKAFGFSGIPSVYVFDREGKLKKAMPAFDPDQEAELIRAAEEAL
jgi:peroxiredoxin